MNKVVQGQKRHESSQLLVHFKYYYSKGTFT